MRSSITVRSPTSSSEIGSRGGGSGLTPAGFCQPMAADDSPSSMAPARRLSFPSPEPRPSLFPPPRLAGGRHVLSLSVGLPSPILPNASPTKRLPPPGYRRMDELQHECGIAAIYHLPGVGPSRLAPLAGPEQVSRLMPRLLLDLQNRGQLAAGMATYNPTRDKLVDTYKQIGTVIEAFRLNHPDKYDSIMKEFAGRAAIGHTRYATCGANDKSYAQPFQRDHGCKWK